MDKVSKGDGHEILNPFGVSILVSKITLRRLDMRGYLQRDRATGLKQIKPSAVGAFLHLERTTYHRELYSVLGPDFSGPTVVLCSCRECAGAAAELDKTPPPGRAKQESAEQADKLIREIKAKRRCA
jgi:hypothetical protein